MTVDMYGSDWKIYTVQNLTDKFIEFPHPYNDYGGFPSNSTCMRICYASFQYHIERFVKQGVIKVISIEDPDVEAMTRLGRHRYLLHLRKVRSLKR